jgi:hypothetical protein
VAKAVQAKGGANPTVQWEIRRQAVQFQEKLHPFFIQGSCISTAMSLLTTVLNRQKLSPESRLYVLAITPAHRSSSCPVSVAINRLLPSETMFVSIQYL